MSALHESALETACSMVLDEGATIYTNELARRLNVDQAMLESAIGDSKDFSVKLSLRIGAKIWQREAEMFGAVIKSEKYPTLTGAQQIKELWKAGFLYSYRGHPDFWRWLNRFERYVINEKIPTQAMGDYQSQLEHFYPIFLNAFNKGLEDGTVRPEVEPEDYYGATTHALMSMCIKFCSAPILSTDTLSSGERYISELIDMSIHYLKR